MGSCCFDAVVTDVDRHHGPIEIVCFNTHDRHKSPHMTPMVVGPDFRTNGNRLHVSEAVFGVNLGSFSETD